MATKAQPVRIGPFTGGVNTYSDPSAIDDTEAAELINFDIHIDGSLRSRPPITGKVTTSYSARLLGVYTTTAGVSYIIFASTNNVGVASTSFYNINTGTEGVITATIGASAMVQYQNKAWLIAAPGSANPGGNWDGTTFTAVAAIQKGNTAIVYKERLFVGTGILDTTNPSRIWFSGPANPTAWSGTDFFDINNGDGQPIVKIYSFNGSIIIFKKYSTFVFSYENSPTRGQVQSISANIGIDGPDCVCEFEGILYVMAAANVYAVNNWNWEQINFKVPFLYQNTYTNMTFDNFSISTVGERIIARYYDLYFVFNTKTKAWSQWVSTRTAHNFVHNPIVNSATGVDEYYSGNYTLYTVGAAGRNIFNFKDGYNGVDSESYNLSIKSKIYSMNVPYSFKRLMWWGIDILSKSNVNAVVVPVTYGIPVRWSDLAGRTWLQAEAFTWSSPKDNDVTVTDSATINNTNGARMFVKFVKSLRFRQIQFKLTSTVDGTTLTGPFNLYGCTAFVINKQLVPKKVN